MVHVVCEYKHKHLTYLFVVNQMWHFLVRTCSYFSLQAPLLAFCFSPWANQLKWTWSHLFRIDQTTHHMTSCAMTFILYIVNSADFLLSLWSDEWTKNVHFKMTAWSHRYWKRVFKAQNEAACLHQSVCSYLPACLSISQHYISVLVGLSLIYL